MMFAGYDVCRIMVFVAYDVFECLAYRVCRSAYHPHPVTNSYPLPYSSHYPQYPYPIVIEEVEMFQFISISINIL